MNQEQINSLIRQVMLVLAGVLGGVPLVAKLFTPEQLTALLTSTTVISTLGGLVLWGISGLWALITRSDKNIVAAADALPQVAGVITKPTTAGIELAESVPSPTVVPAKTVDAEAVIRNP